MQFLVETGADVSVVPPSAAERKHPQTLQLQAVNHTSVSTYGICSLTLNLGLRRTFHWAFIIADVQKTILGTDFLHNFSLLVNIKHHQLLDGLHIQGIAAPDSSLGPTLQPHEPANEFAAILCDFPSVTQQCVSDRPVLHHVITFGEQVHPCPVRHARAPSDRSSRVRLHATVGNRLPIFELFGLAYGPSLAVTTVHLTTALLPTVIPSLIYKISRPPSTESSANLNL